LEEPVQLRAVGDGRTVERELRDDADDLERDADDSRGERGRGEPGSRTLGGAQDAADGGEERDEQGQRREAGDGARREVGLVAVAGGDEEDDGEQGAADGCETV